MKKLFCYVDEVGDPGTSQKSSEIFILGGALVPHEDIREMINVMTSLRTDLSQGSKALHWSQNARSWDRRQHIVKNINEISVSLIYTVAVKKDLRAQRHAYINSTPPYMWSLQLFTERALYAAKEWPGGPRELHLVLSRIKGQHDTNVLNQFKEMSKVESFAPWHLLHRNIQIRNNSELDGLQLADQVCGAMGAAAIPGEFSQQYETEHLAVIANKIRKSPEAKILGYGVKETSPYLSKLPWWNELMKPHEDPGHNQLN